MNALEECPSIFGGIMMIILSALLDVLVVCVSVEIFSEVRFDLVNVKTAIVLLDMQFFVEAEHKLLQIFVTLDEFIFLHLLQMFVVQIGKFGQALFFDGQKLCLDVIRKSRLYNNIIDYYKKKWIKLVFCAYAINAGDVEGDTSDCQEELHLAADGLLVELGLTDALMRMSTVFYSKIHR